MESKVPQNFHGWSVFVLSILLALMVWLFRNLSQEYTNVIELQIIAESSIEGREALSTGVNKVSATVRASGFEMMKLERSYPKPRKVKIQPSDFSYDGGDIFTLGKDNLKRYVSEALSDEVTVENILNDSASFKFARESFRKVPVRVTSELSFKPQYTSPKGIEIEPDSVLVYGEDFRLAKVDAVYTRPLSLSNLEASRRGSLDIDQLSGLRLSESSVHWNIDVVRYVEVSAEVPVVPVNVPSDRSLIIFPTVAQVTLRCVFPLEADPFRNFRLVVEYDSFLSSKDGRCLARPENSSNGMISYTLEPEIFDCAETVLR